MLETTNHLEDKRFGCQIVIHSGKGKGCEPQKAHYWTGLRFHNFNKYRWYFRYRAALLQVKYPMQYVELRNSDYDYVPTREILLKRKRDLVIAQKGLYTKATNRLNDYKNNWVSLFPIEDDLLYRKAITKIGYIQTKVLELQKSYDDFINQTDI